jgi:hypothetical protein
MGLSAKRSLGYFLNFVMGLVLLGVVFLVAGIVVLLVILK